MRPSAALLWLSLLLPALGCGGGQTSSDPRLPTDWGDATVFGDGTILTYAFSMDGDTLARLQATALQEKYVDADLTISGRYVGVVGLRYKGNEGTLRPCFENGVQICPKVSFKVKLDHGDPSLQLEGVTRLNFHSMLDDASQMRERLNAKLFADMGIIAPRVSHAFLTINGEPRGLFAVVEDIDARFVADRWKNAPGGNLYKEAWPFEIDPEAYDPALETNLDRRNHQRMISFARALRMAPAGAPLSAALDKWANLDYLFRFLAVDQVINNYDGITAFYCDANGTGCSNHNFFWYESPTEDRFWLIPWDVGDSFRLRTPFDKVPVWNRPPPNCGQRHVVEGDTVVMSPACDLLFQALQAAGRPAWVKALDRLAEVWDVDALTASLDRWGQQITVATRLDPFGPGPAGWNAGMRSMKRDLHTFRERLLALRDDTRAGGFGLAAPGRTLFRDTSLMSLVMGVSTESNPRSGAFFTLGLAAGASDPHLRFEFEFANDSDAAGAPGFTQWVQLRLPLAEPGDQIELIGVRLRMRADVLRNVRVEIDSEAYGTEGDLPRHGWEILVGKETKDLVLSRAELALPEGAPRGGPGLEEALLKMRGLIITPEPRGRDPGGRYARGQTDRGTLEIDSITID